jgi:hypothetical protein
MTITQDKAHQQDTTNYFEYVFENNDNSKQVVSSKKKKKRVSKQYKVCIG